MLNTLDETDIRILQLLQENARLTNKQIAEKLNKTVTPIFRRIKRLEDDGFITGYVATLDDKKIERSVMVFTLVKLSDHNNKSFNHFEREIVKFPEVLECYHLSGIFDFILKVSVKDIDAYERFLSNSLFNDLPLGQVQTAFVMKKNKEKTAFPIFPIGLKKK